MLQIYLISCLQKNIFQFRTAYHVAFSKPFCIRSLFKRIRTILSILTIKLFQLEWVSVYPKIYLKNDRHYQHNSSNIEKSLFRVSYSNLSFQFQINRFPDINFQFDSFVRDDFGLNTNKVVVMSLKLFRINNFFAVWTVQKTWLASFVSSNGT